MNAKANQKRPHHRRLKKERKDTGQKYYQDVLERYKAYESAITAKDQTALQNELKKIEATSEEYAYVFNLQTLGSINEWQYAFEDLNQDGNDELLIGDGKTIAAVYYLKDNKPTLLHVAYVASAGGYRSSLDVFDNGQIVYATWQSLNPEMELTLYSLGKGEAKEEKKTTIQIGGNQTAEQALGISAKKLDLAKLDWKTFDGSGNSKSTSKAEEKKTGSFQIQVSVSDLRIRKEPSTSAPSVGMIAKGTYTITETVEADGHTWGKLESGQGWIALDFTTRVDGSKSTASSKKSSGMNIQEIQNGNFSSIAGTWRNGKGMSVTFDDNGISKINGAPTDQVVDRFNHEFGYLSSSVHSTAPAGASAMSFFPAGQEFPASLKYGNFSVDNSKDIIYWGQNVISDQSDLFYKEG